MKVLVTGCAGYLGSVLCHHLLTRSSDLTVVGLDSLFYKNGQALAGLLGHPCFSFERADVRDLSATLRLATHCDAVVHLAAVVGAPACDRLPVMATHVNQEATSGLARGLSRHQRLVYPNTNSGYGKGDGTPVTEDSPLRPLSLYAKTKCAGEKEVLDHPLGVSFRLATVFGVSPRMRYDLLVNDFTSRLAGLVAANGGGMLKLFEPHFMRNYVHVRDVARVMALAVLDHSMGGVYNFGHPEANLSKLDLALRVLRVLNAPPGHYVRVCDGVDQDQRDYVVSNDRILAYGFHFDHTLDEGIREVAQHCELVGPTPEMGNV